MSVVINQAPALRQAPFAQHLPKKVIEFAQERGLVFGENQIVGFPRYGQDQEIKAIWLNFRYSCPQVGSENIEFTAEFKDAAGKRILDAFWAFRNGKWTVSGVINRQGMDYICSLSNVFEEWLAKQLPQTKVELDSYSELQKERLKAYLLGKKTVDSIRRTDGLIREVLDKVGPIRKPSLFERVSFRCSRACSHFKATAHKIRDRVIRERFLLPMRIHRIRDRVAALAQVNFNPIQRQLLRNFFFWP